MSLLRVPVRRLPSAALQPIRYDADDLACGVPMSTGQCFEAFGHGGDYVSCQADAASGSVGTVRFGCPVWWFWCKSQELMGGRGEQAGLNAYGSIVYAGVYFWSDSMLSSSDVGPKQVFGRTSKYGHTNVELSTSRGLGVQLYNNAPL